MKVLELKNLEWLTVEQAAQIMQCSASKIRTSISQGKIRVFRDGKLIRIHQNEMDRYIREFTV